jgi:hypothetical protein
MVTTTLSSRTRIELAIAGLAVLAVVGLASGTVAAEFQQLMGDLGRQIAHAFGATKQTSSTIGSAASLLGEALSLVANSFA